MRMHKREVELDAWFSGYALIFTLKIGIGCTCEDARMVTEMSAKFFDAYGCRLLKNDPVVSPDRSGEHQRVAPANRNDDLFIHRDRDCNASEA
jgi:hypothetical protein